MPRPYWQSHGWGWYIGKTLKQKVSGPNTLEYKIGEIFGAIENNIQSGYIELLNTFADSPKSWTVDAKSIDKTTFDLSVKNPNGGEEVKHRRSQKIMDEIAKLDAESAKVLERIGRLL